MASHARQQYFADGETLKKEAREFAMTDELKQKLDSIEWGAQVNVIEDVKVNGVSLEVVDKSVDVLVPLVIDNLYTVDGDNALSAKQGKILYDYIQNLQSRGRYLSNWNTATGLPSTNPSESPYEYRAGDYFVVSVTAATGGTNYRPDGSSYTIGVASTTVETEPVHITDIYLYDGTNWLLLTNSTREIPIDDALSTTSTNPVENRVVTNAINTKQDKLIAGNNIQIAQDGKTISATDTTYSAGTNVSIDANNVISAVDTTYTAGANINIDANNVISATDTVYAEGTGIDITDNIISNEGVLSVNGNNGNVTVNDVKVSSTAPANPTEGVVWYDTANDILKMYDGTNWNPVGENDRAIWGNITGTLSNQTDLQNALDAKQDKFFTKSTTAPSNPSEGDQWYDDTNNVMKFYDGTEWKKIDTDTDVNAIWGNITGTLSNQTDLQTALDTDRVKSFYLPSDVTTAESLATAQAAYEYMAVGVPIIRMGSMYDTSPGTLTFFPVKKVNPGASGTMIFSAIQLSKATTGGYTMVFQDRVEFTVVDGQVTSITKQFTNSNSALFRFLETNVSYSSTYTPTYSGSPTNKKYVDKWDTAVSATAPGTDLYEGKLWYDTTNDVLKAYDGTNWNVTGKVYTAGTGINITNDVISCTLNPVTVSQTAPSNPESGDLWFNTTKQTLNLYNGTSWVLVGPEIVPITKAAYDLLSSADKNDGRFYLITDNDGTIYVEWANVQNAPISAGTTAPSSPNEGDIWYDTTNDILKVYDGTNWNGVGQGSGDVVGPSSATDGHVAVFDGATGKIIKDGGALPEESNTKTFPLSGTGNSASVLAEAQAIYDWYAAGKNPIVIFNNKAYIQAKSSSYPNALSFVSADTYLSASSSYTNVGTNMLNIMQSGGTVTSVQSGSSYCNFLETGRNYQTPYTPEYDGSPATKKYVDDNTKAVSGVSTTQPSNPVAGSTYYDTTNNVLMVYDGTSWNAAGKTYTAGNGIDITNDVISADIVAGNGINITGGINCTTESDRRGPSPSGFHIPSSTEWGTVKSIWNTLGGGIYQGDALGVALKLPKSGYREHNTGEVTPDIGNYWGSSPGTLEGYAAAFSFGGANPIFSDGNSQKASGLSLRAFKNTPVVPDNTWTKTYGTSIEAGGIFRSSSLGLVSLSGDGSTWITMQDKNIGATTVWDSGDTITQANGGNYFQWGNNYGFPFTGSVTTSSTQVDASGYGPGNYYSSDTFILSSAYARDRSSSTNNDLWGDTSNSTHQECTGVTSTLTISSDTTSGSGAPSSTPTYIGQQYVDTTNDMLYVATGTSSSSDWTLVGANTGVEVQVISQSDYDALTEAEKNADVIYLITGGSGGLTVAWTNITGKPDLIINPSGGTAGQLLAKTANGYEWTTVNSATWGNISGTLSNQTDLQNALDAKQDELNAGTGINIGDITINGRQGPCPNGFHVPSQTELSGVADIMENALAIPPYGGSREMYLKMPMAGKRAFLDGSQGDDGGTGMGCYWTSTPNSTNAYALSLMQSSVSISGDYRSQGYSIRAFKDSYVAPDSSWTVLYGTLGSAGIFWDQTNGLISITGNGTTGYTIMDKNLGATEVFDNYNPSYTAATCGYYYQWGNNYGFAGKGGSVTTSTTQVDASGYGPSTANGYYESDTFIVGSTDWSSVQNDNLWGDTTGTVTTNNVITNTGVLSVNGQTGNVTIASGGMQLAPNSPLTPTYFWYGTQAQYEALSQYYTEEEGDTVYYTI